MLQCSLPREKQVPDASLFFFHRTTWQRGALFLWQESGPRRSQGSLGHSLHHWTPLPDCHYDFVPQTPLCKEADSLPRSPVLCTPHGCSGNSLAFLGGSCEVPQLARWWANQENGPKHCSPRKVYTVSWIRLLILCSIIQSNLLSFIYF